MTRASILAAGVLVGFALAGAPAAAQSTDPWIGTWNLNLQKSQVSPGPLSKSGILSVVPVPGGYEKHIIDRVNAQGQHAHSERAAKFDGQWVPVDVTPASAAVTTNSFRLLGEPRRRRLAGDAYV